MIFDIPHDFFVNGTKIGNKVNSSSWFAESVEVDIEMLDDSSAPVAFEWDARPFGREIERKSSSSRRLLLPKDGMRHVRRHGDVFYTPLLIGEATGSDETRPMAVEDFVLAIEARGLHWPRRSPDERRPVVEDALSRYSSIEEDGRDRSAAALREAFSQLAVIEGTVYARCERPRLVVAYTSFPYPAHSSTIALSVVKIVFDRGDIASANSESIHPVSHYAKAIQAATRHHVAPGAQDIRHAMIERPHPVVTDPGMKDRWESKLTLLQSDVMIFVRLFESRKLDVTATDDIRAYCALRDALSGFPGEESLASIESAARHFNDHGHKNVRKSVKRMLEICEERPVSPTLASSPFAALR